MTLPVKSLPFTPEEYLRLEREAPYKSEYHDGEMFAMAGASARHSLINANLVGTLGAQLKTLRFILYGSDLRIRVPGVDLYTYPDLSVFCEPTTFLPGTDDTAKATEAYDRGRKFEAYRQVPSLREYLLVSQDAPTIERFTREGDDRWVLTTARGLDAVVPLDCIGASLPLAKVYENVDFQRPEPAAETN